MPYLPQFPGPLLFATLLAATTPSSTPPANSNTPPPTAYMLTKLSTAEGESSEANGINATGQVVGWFSNASEKLRHAFLYSKGQRQELAPAPGESSEAMAINSSGQIAGNRIYQGHQPMAFLYANGKMQNLGALGGFGSEAFAINDSGKIVGRSQTVMSGNLSGHPTNIYEPQAFLYDGGKMRNLDGRLGSSSRALSVDDSGTIVGAAEVQVERKIAGRSGVAASATPHIGTNNLPWETHAASFSDGHAHDLGALDGTTYSEARAVNQAGQIAGVSLTNMRSPGHAFLYSGGKMQDLGTLGGTYSQANAINNEAQVAGFAADQPDKKGGWTNQHAFLYAKGKMQDLNELVGAETLAAAGFKTLLEARGINDHGQIVGVGEDLQGHHQAFLLTPSIAGSARPTIAAAIPTSAPAAYTVTTVDTPVPQISEANAINAAGQVVGWYANYSEAVRHAFLYDKGKRQDLDTDQGEFSEATAINSHGQIIGNHHRPGHPQSAFLFANGQMKEIASLGGWDCAVSAVNDSGKVVGESMYNVSTIRAVRPTTSSSTHAFLYEAEGAPSDLDGRPGLGSRALAINYSGVIVGAAEFGVDTQNAARSGRSAGSTPPGVQSSGMHAATFSSGQVHDLGTLGGGENSEARAINDSGQIAGVSTTNTRSRRHAFLYSNGKMQDLGTLGSIFSQANALNKAGQVVGFTADEPDKKGGLLNQRAFLYANGKMQDLNELVGADALTTAGLKTLLEARGINELGQIVGVGVDLQGRHEAFVLTPVKPPKS